MRNKRNGRPRRARRGNCLSLGTVPVQSFYFYWTAHTSPPDVDFRIRLVSLLNKGCALHIWQESLRQYQLVTVTYGTAPASILATRCLNQLASEEASS